MQKKEKWKLKDAKKHREEAARLKNPERKLTDDEKKKKRKRKEAKKQRES
jgi:hypothetical protein